MLLWNLKGNPTLCEEYNICLADAEVVGVLRESYHMHILVDIQYILVDIQHMLCCSG